MGKAADAIFEGVRQALRHARCEHDWYDQSGDIRDGYLIWKRTCMKCKTVETVFDPIKKPQ